MSIKYPCIYWNEGMCKKFSDDKSTSWCIEGPCGEQVPSNADKIRAMSDEELARWLEYEGGGACAEMCGWLNWLKQPAEEGER